MEERQLSITKTANYVLTGNKNSKKLLLAFHGYGQLVKYFARKFHTLKEDYLIVCPEALHYFYTQGFQGRVGASWMTRENRETEIKDYLHYLDTLLLQVKKEFTTIDQVSLLGFSQGTATASRYFMHTKEKIDKLILWSGFPAQDIDYTVFKKKLGAGPMFLIQGTTDELRPEELFKKTITEYKEKDFPFHLSYYQGGHAIDAECLNRIMKL